MNHCDSAAYCCRCLAALTAGAARADGAGEALLRKLPSRREAKTQVASGRLSLQEIVRGRQTVR